MQTPNKFDIIEEATSDLPVYDFSDDNKIAKALKDAPAVKAMKSKGLVPVKPAAKKSGKAGRIVGISADENKFIQELLQSMKIGALSPYSQELVKNPSFAKIEARYNK